MNYMNMLNVMRYDELPTWLAMQESFDDDSSCYYIKPKTIQRRTMMQAAFNLYKQPVLLPLVKTMRHAKQLMWAYIVLNPPEGCMIDYEMIEDIHLNLGTAAIKNIYHDGRTRAPVIIDLNFYGEADLE
jgi:hypothetical protein